MISNNIDKQISVYSEDDCTKIKKLFQSNVSGFSGITHLSLILITKEKKHFILSSSKDFTRSFKENEYHKYDNTLDHLMYENLKFYTWTQGYSMIKQNEIKKIKKEYGLNNGTVFVRNLQDGSTLLYCVATKKTDPIMKTIFINNANQILSLGDNIYNEVIDFFQDKSEIHLQKIISFTPFLQDEITDFRAHETNQKIKISNIIKSNKEERNLRLIVDNTKK